jgi:hypothetical protein
MERIECPPDFVTKMIFSSFRTSRREKTLRSYQYPSPPKKSENQKTGLPELEDCVIQIDDQNTYIFGKTPDSIQQGRPEHHGNHQSGDGHA